MKERLEKIYRAEPSSIKGIIAYELLRESVPKEFFDDFIDRPFEDLRAYRYTCFTTILKHKEQFELQVNQILPGDYSDLHIWQIFRMIAVELERELKFDERSRFSI